MLAAKYLNLNIIKRCVKKENVVDFERGAKKAIKVTSKFDTVHEVIKFMFDNDTWEGTSYLIYSYHYGSQVLIDYFREQLDPDYIVDYSNQLLNAACHGGMIDYVIDIIENGFFVSEDLFVPLCFACRGKQREIVDYLISRDVSFEDVCIKYFRNILKSGFIDIIDKFNHRLKSNPSNYKFYLYKGLEYTRKKGYKEVELYLMSKL